MTGYTFSDSLLLGLLDRLKNLNSIYEDSLSSMNAQQLNQISSLRELGIVDAAPEPNSKLGGGQDGPPRPEPTLLRSIEEQLNRLDVNLGFGKQQVEDAKFIGDALYRQFANPKDQPVTASAR